jgi:hypothetical protein
MGGGGFDIHYGIFRKPTDTVYEASKATNDRLLTCLDWTHPVTKDSVVLDLGSGHGGISHEVRCILLRVNCSFLLLFLYGWIPCVGDFFCVVCRLSFSFKSVVYIFPFRLNNCMTLSSWFDIDRMIYLFITHCPPHKQTKNPSDCRPIRVQSHGRKHLAGAEQDEHGRSRETGSR